MTYALSKIEAWLKESEERTKAATPGPWERYQEFERNGQPGVRVCETKEDIVPEEVAYETPGLFEVDAQFIAHVRTDHERALAALREAVRFIDSLGEVMPEGVTAECERIAALLDGKSKDVP